MKTTLAPSHAADRLRELVGRLGCSPGFPEVVASLQAGHGATLDGVWGSSRALTAAALVEDAPATVVVIAPHPDDVDRFLDDFSLFSGVAADVFPAWEAATDERTLRDSTFGERIRLLKSLASELPPRLVGTSIQALVEPVPSAESLVSHTRQIRLGDDLDPAALAAWLVERGYHATTAVELPGEFSSRGGIFDLFAADWQEPVRIELFGEQIESIRRFDVATQRSLGNVEAIELTILSPQHGERGHFAAHLPRGSWFLLIEPWELEQEGRQYRDRLDRPEATFTVSESLNEVYRFPSATMQAIAGGSLEATCRLKVESVERFSGEINKVRDELDVAGLGSEVHIVCETQAEADRLAEVFSTTKVAAEGNLHLPLGRLHAGFRLVSERAVVVSSGELFHRDSVARPAARRLGRVIDSFLDLREGDYIVHIAHGIGRYRGLKLLAKGDHTEEHLELEFGDATKIYVPASKINLVQKYVGGTKTRPTLAKIGGRSWVRQKAAVEQAVTDMAAEMLDLQAARALRPGIAFAEDSEWQREFDAQFPYVETPDQIAAIASSKRDMQGPRPMDRLICGDVGYGKTEVAMRAAFKAIDCGFQVAILVPTTVLAEQHRRTFTSRMAEFPFQIAALSRFCSRKEQTKIVERLAAGSLDLVIGTHRLVQPDVAFHNLGLVIIDEEQRFGVDVKERLKTLKQTVDVLTLTATPIPRTLHMALLGIRDISNLETPPADRLAVETRVTRFDDEMIRHAVLRELNRGGQIYFVHNRIYDIQAVASRLSQIVPEASLAIGHGQMPEGELEQVMFDFVNHRFDMLVSTTIVESGLDIPNSNTMFIDQADQYGLADLHQLRGRVGRYKHRAYCYLLVDPHKHLSPSAAKRLKAIEEFSQMGAGFALAMRDLEIRGAGNILGTEQSGHIAVVGYELYCELLEQAVRTLKDLPPKAQIDVNIDLPGEAFIPRRYVSDMRMKIDLYRRINRVSKEAELDDLKAELVDRFGPRPEPVDRLLALTRLKLWAHSWQIEGVHLEDSYLVCRYRTRKRIEQLAAKTKGRLRVVDNQSAYLPLKQGLSDPDILIEQAESLLRPI